MSFAEDYEIYKQNILPGMLEVLAEDLGCEVASLQQLGVGFYPAKQVWVFAERDHKGEVVGLSHRTSDGKKFMAEGSKRGLVYPYNENALEGEERYEAGRCSWVRVQEAGIECPVCGKPDWCMVSSDDPADPSAVLCSRVSEGATRTIGEAGYLHLRSATVSDYKGGSAILSLKNDALPIIICEGASDVLAALDLGFTAIGRPSAKGGMEELKQMPLAGKEIWIIGENDAGAGKEGMDKTLLNLEHLSSGILCVIPPEGVKDLRQWVARGITQENLTAYIKEFGHAKLEDSNIFPDDIAQTIAKHFLDEHRDSDGILTLRSYHGKWTEWHNGRYERLEDDVFRGRVYAFLENKRFTKPTKNGVEIVDYKPTRSKVNDIIDALSCWCPVFDEPPVWIDQKGRPEIRSLLAFSNGILDIDEFCKGNIKLLNPTPDLFTFATLPYAYSSKAWSNMFRDYCGITFNEDGCIIKLLAEWLGYNIVYDTSHEKFMMFVGQRRSGKSTILSAMEAMLGLEQCGSTSLSMLANTHGLGSLVGKSTVIAGDIKGTIRRSEMDAALEVILRITGRDRIPINQKYMPVYDAELQCRFTMAMNDLPLFTDHSQAIVARTLILPFPNCYEGREDFTLKDRLREEAAEGKLINFALGGLKRLRKRGRFTEPLSSREHINQFKQLTSPMLAFIEECCNVGDGLKVSKDQMYEAWKGWCESCDHKQGNKMLFGRWLIQHQPTVKSVQEDGMYVYRGITLKPWVFMKYLGRPC